MQPAYYEDFNEIKKKIWLMLDGAITNRSSQFRIPTFICGDQFDFDGRIVVLRKSDQQNNTVQFHSDIRSDKIEKLKKNSKAAMLFYDKEEKIQVRLKVQCTVNHENDITKESWLKLSSFFNSAITYFAKTFGSASDLRGRRGDCNGG